MKNISFNKEPIQLKCGIKYIIIDAIYLKDIRKEISNLNIDDIFNEIRNKVFPYTDTPFATYIPRKATFTLGQIKKIDYDQIIDGDKSILSTDSGVLVFINEKILKDFVLKFDYDEFVNSEIELINIAYWNFIVDSYNLLDIAFVVSPGINSGVDFDGSGSYKIE